MSAFHAPMEWCAYTGIYDSCGEHNHKESGGKGGGAGVGTKQSGDRIFFLRPCRKFRKGQTIASARRKMRSVPNNDPNLDKKHPKRWQCQ